MGTKSLSDGRLRSVVRDISERKRVEQELKLSAEIMENMAEGVCLLRVSDDLLVFTNPRFDEIFGYETGELIGRHPAILIAPGERTPQETANRILQNLEKTGIWSGDVQTIRKDETLFWTHSSVSTFEHPQYGTVRVAVVTDITDRKQAEKALRESEARYRRLAELMPAAMYTCDAEGRITYFNEQAATFWGRKPKLGVTDEQFCGSFRMYQPDGSLLPHDKAPMSAAVNQGHTFRNQEVTVERPDGSRINVLANVEPIVDASGTRIGAINVFFDITERKRAEQASREKQAQLDGLLANVDAIILEGDPFNFYYVGGQVEKILGYPKEMWFEHPEGPGGFWAELLHPDDLDKPEFCWQAINRGEDHCFEYRLIAKDGTPIWFYDTVMVETRDGKPVKTRSVMIDITDRKQAEEEARKHREELAHVSRVSVMGEMATGIAHELNQPLAAIAFYSHAAKRIAERSNSSPHALQEILGKLKDQALRSGDIVRRWRNFVKKSESTRVPVDLNTLVKDVAKFVEPDIHQANAMLVLQTAEPSPHVLVDEIQIQQVLVNLIRNAIDAMQETPTGQREVTVSTRILQDSRAEVTVRDAGQGLAQNEFEQVFNAFYSTKPEGVGMGLPISRSLVEAHGGKLWAEPNTGSGMTFGFTLPRSDCHSR